MPLNAMAVPQAFFEQVEKHRTRVALRHKQYGIWNKVTWGQYGENVRQVAAAILSLELPRGQTVCILGDNRPEWLICHMAIMTAGMRTCGIYPTSSPDEIRYIIDHSEAQLLFAENEEQLDKILDILPNLRLQRIVVWDEKGLWGYTHPRVVFLREFIRRAEAHLADHPVAVTDSLRAIDVEQTAMVIYTSGTTGRPKGALLSHRNISMVTQAFLQIIPVSEKDEVVSYLPLAHIYENLVSVFMPVFTGVTVNFVESLETLPANLREISPTIFGSVPRIWEKFASNIHIKIDDSTPLKRFLYRRCVQVGRRYQQARQAGAGSLLVWRAVYALAYWGVLYHLKRQLGFERIRWALCSAAAASKELFEFFNILGIPLRDGYGQTESTGIIALQRLDKEPRYGYVGEALPGLEMRISTEGEILARGPGVFQGYFKNPELTEETLRDGWLHTGDLGAIDDGWLKIVGRMKDILITSGGKNITPEFIENKLKFSTYIQDAVIIGDGRHYLTALILIDEDNVVKFAQDNRIPFATFEDLTQNPAIVKLLDGEVKEVNETLARVETIKKFALIPRRFYAEDGDVTPTQKVKRRNVEKLYKDLIDEMYRGEA
ncbi:MAG: AMP-binding protein [Syntrophales bacterium]|nr:AMP-binding protein [Syntrophales bacterium]MDD4338132.1 AMP-binding protein [Syntrophales bacterium]HOG06655.1 AMP-binding protein [Syntrophales bacterium]HOS76484.1 AMP-binding protein [Syntrophales bacterium]HPB69352.1 AMP-binding protein [Syntrophales bacterium]